MKRKRPTIPVPLGAELREAALIAAMYRRAAELQQENLMKAVLLAQQAACGHGPLVEHFAELGRQYGGTLTAPARARQGLRVIEGGTA